jgi:type III pantothenate kinase
MNLLVDIGNSRIKYIQQDSHGLSNYQDDFYEKPDLAGSLDRLWDKLPMPDQIWIANVAGSEVADQLVRWIDKKWHIRPEFAVVTKTALGVINAYTEVTRLGIDRWLAIIATWNKYGSAACIVDCGTAVTIDGLNHHGRHLGGLITPGVAMMQQSLYKTVSAIPYIRDMKPTTGLACNTEQAVVTGCTIAIVSLIEHVLQDMQRECEGELKCVITGGDSETIMPLLAGKFVYEPYLVLEGLALHAGNNP